MFVLAYLTGIAHGAVLFPRETNSSATPYATAPEAPATQPSLSYTSTSKPTTPITISTNSGSLISPSVTIPTCYSNVEYDTYSTSINPNAPTQWVLYPTSLPMPCYLQVPYACLDCGIYWYDYYSNKFRDPYFLDNLWFTDTLMLSCESIWSSSLVTWIQTAPTTYVPVATTPVYETVLPTTVTVSSTIYWMGETTETITYDVGEIGYTEYGSYQITVASATAARIADYISTIVGTTILIPTQASDTRAYFLSSFPFTAASPCCSTCSVFGKNVQVFQWPTPAPSPPISTLIDPRSNFTFVSPQVYVAFESVFAADLCGPVGSVLYTTVGFSPNELSTSQVYTYDTSFPPYNNPFPPTGFTQATWGQVSVCTGVTSTFWQALGSSAILADAAEISNFSQTAATTYLDACSVYSVGDYAGSCVKKYSVTYNPCSPVLSVPTKLFSLNSLWTGCVQGISAFFDPPYTLSPGGPMSLITSADPATRQAYQQTMTSNAAIAGATVPLVTPTRTSVLPPKTTAYNEPNPVDPTLDLPAPLASGLVIGSQTLAAPPGAVTISNTVLSVLPDGLSIAIGGTTTMPIGKFLASEAGNVGYLFGTQILSAGGPAITVDGVEVSLMTGGASVVIGSRTEGASVLVGGSSINGMGASPSCEGTDTGVVLQQAGTGTPAIHTSSSTGATSTQRGDYCTWMLGTLVGVWIIGIGFL